MFFVLIFVPLSLPFPAKIYLRCQRCYVPSYQVHLLPLENRKTAKSVLVSHIIKQTDRQRNKQTDNKHIDKQTKKKKKKKRKKENKRTNERLNVSLLISTNLEVCRIFFLFFDSNDPRLWGNQSMCLLFSPDNGFATPKPWISLNILPL